MYLVSSLQKINHEKNDSKIKPIMVLNETGVSIHINFLCYFVYQSDNHEIK